MFLKIQVATILIPRNAFEVFYVPSSLIWPMLIPAFFTRAIFPTETIFCHCSFTWGIFNNPLKLIKRDHLFLLCPELWQNNSPSDLVTSVKLGASCWQAWYFSYFLVAETQDVISIWWCMVSYFYGGWNTRETQYLWASESLSVNENLILECF